MLQVYVCLCLFSLGDYQKELAIIIHFTIPVTTRLYHKKCVQKNYSVNE